MTLMSTITEKSLLRRLFFWPKCATFCHKLQNCNFLTILHFKKYLRKDKMHNSTQAMSLQQKCYIKMCHSHKVDVYCDHLKFELSPKNSGFFTLI